MVRILQLCLYRNSNFGDTVSRDALLATLERMGQQADVDSIDLLKLHQSGKSLDEKLSEINDTYDCVVIGPGGLLAYYILDWAFTDVANWQRLEPPLILFGIGLIGHLGRPTFYTRVNENEHKLSTVAVLKAAAVVAVRDNRSLLLARRVLSGGARTYLTGCPTMQFVRSDTKGDGSFLLNLPMNHGPTNQMGDLLKVIGRHLVISRPHTVWLCHSEQEVFDARDVCDGLEDQVSIVKPKQLSDVGSMLASCGYGLVVKAHPAIFATANLIPISFLSYDMKCLALLEMISDEPMKLTTNLTDLNSENFVSETKRLTDEMIESEKVLKLSQSHLRDHFDEEFGAFETAFRGLLSNNQ